MADATTIPELLQAGALDANAIGAPEGVPPLTYRGLTSLCGRTVAALNGLGVGRDDRVAIVLPNGPEMATAFVCVGAGATTAPLNPAYRAEELEFYLTDLKAKALVVQAGADTPARAVAKKLGVPVVELTPHREEGAGAFTLRAMEAMGGLLLHTSGTTSRPKLVPLSHANLAASARHIGSALALTPSDRCLNIMPLFHIHGLIAAVLSSLSAGGERVLHAGLQRAEVLRLAGRGDADLVHGGADHASGDPRACPPQSRGGGGGPSAAHPLVVGLAAAAGDGGAGGDLPLPGDRVIRHDRSRPSDGLQPAAAARAQARQCRPRCRTRGRDHGSGRRLPAGRYGEIVIRGPNVTAGYENNPEANRTAFAHGWFHTGDQGTMDADGYVRVTGRLKEIINRGGEKISPLEVDEVLMDHPAVAQVVTFAMPHDKLGEEVAAAVVLREGMTAAERELRDFAAGRLADFKVPRKIVILTEIPKGATGKLQRIGLAQKGGRGWFWRGRGPPPPPAPAGACPSPAPAPPGSREPGPRGPPARAVRRRPPHQPGGRPAGRRPAPRRPSPRIPSRHQNNRREAAGGGPPPSGGGRFAQAPPPASPRAPRPGRGPGGGGGEGKGRGRAGVLRRPPGGGGEADADRFIFGYTCVNDVTALDLITRDPFYAQWTRAKSFDGFGPIGPAIATGLDPEKLVVRTLVKGKVRQEYPISDAIFGPRALVAHLSRQLTLLPGDVIACGTSVGIGVLRAGLTVEVSIEGIGTLTNPVAESEPA